MNKSDVRNLCIRRNWFTNGDTNQYDTMFDMLDDGRYNLRDIATVIWICSKDTTVDEVYKELEKLDSKNEITVEVREQLYTEIRDCLLKSISSEYVDDVLNDTDENGEHPLISCIASNVFDTSAWEDEGYWNEDDIRLAIGRELIERLNPYARW